MRWDAATGDLVAYLDDDNAIVPEFVAATVQFLEQHPMIMCSLAQQWRQREQVEGDTVPGALRDRLIRSGQPFAAPTAGATVDDLLSQRELFNSNGLTHRRQNAPQWNSSYCIFADYEFFLQCLTCWRRESFRLHPVVLVEYVQRYATLPLGGRHHWPIKLPRLGDRT